jgi:hypothetical protein
MGAGRAMTEMRPPNERRGKLESARHEWRSAAPDSRGAIGLGSIGLTLPGGNP